MNRLPDFSLADYRALLRAFKDRGCRFEILSDLPLLTAARNFVCLRHDVDCHPSGVLDMAALEAEEGVRATYYILVAGPYNPRSPACAAVPGNLKALGHEIGLHYDLRTWPVDPLAAVKHLRREITILGDITGAEVRTISCHQPHMGLPDPFLTCDDFVHCHDPGMTHDMLYVSDSCRAWRDENLLTWLHAVPGEAPRGLQFLTHPELWLAGHIHDRMEYLETVLTPLIVREAQQFAGEEMCALWSTHEGARLHDARVRAAK